MVIISFNVNKLNQDYVQDIKISSKGRTLSKDNLASLDVRVIKVEITVGNIHKRLDNLDSSVDEHKDVKGLIGMFKQQYYIDLDAILVLCRVHQTGEDRILDTFSSPILKGIQEEQGVILGNNEGETECAKLS
ncbi:hypothetical protein Nepgr_023537 [Nepenthes gracilis]|uniref:Uncharacterized protein n=1 Tax=Nepenthes gracilis TaxID=150966 RepID=A0AAD3T1F0_NEPGR|nr:hypothetical protein Nepgr_023537 [Nepenthes gracilis]